MKPHEIMICTTGCRIIPAACFVIVRFAARYLRFFVWAAFRVSELFPEAQIHHAASAQDLGRNDQ
jgi:hypothetical protein